MTDKPRRIKSILDYLQNDVPKLGDNEESVPGQDMSSPGSADDLGPSAATPMVNNDDRVKRRKRSVV